MVSWWNTALHLPPFLAQTVEHKVGLGIGWPAIVPLPVHL